MIGDNAETLDMLDRRERRRISRARLAAGDARDGLTLGGFVDARVETLDASELAQFEALLDADDDVAFRWFCGAEPLPPAYDTPLFKKIAAFHADRDKRN